MRRTPYALMYLCGSIAALLAFMGGYPLWMLVVSIAAAPVIHAALHWSGRRP